MASTPMAAAQVAAAPVVAPAGTSAASKAEIAEAEKHAKLLVWAAKTAAEKGYPQAAMMQSRADEAVAALEVMRALTKSGASGPSTPSAPVAAVTPAPVSAPQGAPTKEELVQAKKQVDL